MNIGQIVTITDLTLPITGVITQVTRYEDVTIYQVTSLTGLQWSCEEQDLELADDALAAQFTQDVKLLAPTQPKLAVAFAQVIRPMDEVVPGTLLKDLPITIIAPSGNIVTRREVAAEMIRTRAMVVARNYRMQAYRH